MARIGTWNLENLFRPGAGKGPTGAASYDAKLAALAGTIERLHVDVLLVQEVGDPAALQDLVGRLTGTWHTALADPDGRGIRVGVMSRTALGDVQQVRDFPALLGPVQVSDDGATISRMGRPALRARVGGLDLDVVSLHLKSKLLSFHADRFTPHDEDERARYAVYALHRRAAEAAGVRAFVTALLAGDGEHHRLVVGGDFNDEPTAATTQIVLGPPGSEIGTAGFKRRDRGDATRLWNLDALIPQYQRFSRVYRDRGELIDHLMVSNALSRVVTAVTTGDVDVPSVADDPNALRDLPGSDHRPVVATFAL
jgi:endonuclease/exonuclease/phosphatase family metal-dependent hydrolase